MVLFPLTQYRPLVGKVSNDLSWKYPCFMKNFSFFPPRTSIIMNLASCQENAKFKVLFPSLLITKKFYFY